MSQKYFIKKEKGYAWGILFSEDVLLGKGWFGWDEYDWSKGTRSALFRTRQDARDAMKMVNLKRFKPRAKVVKVFITYEWDTHAK